MTTFIIVSIAGRGYINATAFTFRLLFCALSVVFMAAKEKYSPTPFYSNQYDVHNCILYKGAVRSVIHKKKKFQAWVLYQMFENLPCSHFVME
jgi:hypothetical protein